VGAIIFLAPLPLLATLLVAWNYNQPWYVASYVAVGCVVSAIAAMLMRPVGSTAGQPPWSR
jgi:hypothetical protein